MHHVLHKKQYPGLLFEPRNLVVLCAKCHCRLHRGRELEFFSRLQGLDPAKWDFVWSWLKAH